MIKNTLTVALLISGAICFSQTNSELKSQLEYCKEESQTLEADLDKYKKLLEIQGEEIAQLKTTLQEKESEIQNLKDENQELKMAAESLLELGIKFEEEGKYEEALEIYKLLMKSYPSSIEALSSKLKIIDIKNKKEEGD